MKRLLILILALALPLCTALSVSAAELELNKNGSISIVFACPHGFKSQGSATLYRIADVSKVGDEISFIHTEDFSDSGLTLEGLDQQKLASSYYRYAESVKIKGETKRLKNGTVSFKDLSAGLYLIVHKDKSEAVTEALPFFVTIPTQVDGEYQYDINAAPKVQIKHGDDELPPSIPQTGQLKWPIPVLAAAGIVVFTFGWVLCFKKGKKQ